MNDKCFEALADEYRRTLLVELRKESPQQLSNLVFSDGRESLGEADRRLAIRLHHRHLPKLSQYQFIRWDRETDEISQGPHFDELRPLLDFLIRTSESL